MKHTITIGIYALIIIFTVSCTRDNFLDIEPKGKIIPDKIEDYRLLLDQTESESVIGTKFSSGFLGKHNNAIYWADHIQVTPETVPLIGIEQNQLNLFLYRDLIYGPDQGDDDWEEYYNQIFVANIILEGLSSVANGTTDEIAALEAEAKLHRAYAYFNLVNQYGVHYNPATAASDLGVPLRNSSDLEDVNLERASVQEVYDFIIDEIESSTNNLPDIQPSSLNFRPSKAAAYGLLSKIFSYQSKYDEALDAVENALALYSELRDINMDEVEEDPGFATERYWPDPADDVQIIWHKKVVLDLALTEEYIDLFENNDLRSQWFGTLRERESIDVDGSILVANQNNFFSGTDGIRTSDLYLIRSECNARLGNLAAVNTDLNALRTNRFETGTYTPLSITDQDILLAFVKEERRREFPSGLERTFDIKRYNLFDGDAISIAHSFNGETVTIAPNSPNWAQPIGQLYINQNTEITQNPRE